MNVIAILEVFGATLVALGGIEGIKYLAHRNQEKRKAEAEADTAEIGAEKALRDMYEETIAEQRKEYTERISELHKSIDEANRYNSELLKSSAKKEELIDDKTAKIRDLNEALLLSQKREGNLRLFISTQQRWVDWLKQWHCSREQKPGRQGCLRRKPPQSIPLEYSIPKGLDMEELGYAESLSSMSDGKKDMLDFCTTVNQNDLTSETKLKDINDTTANSI